MLLAEHPAFSPVREARHGAEAVRMIGSEAPDIVFLDVQMPEMDGFEVVRTIGPEHMPAIVFVTAHDRYAIQAFEMNAIDYLLKPVSRERFEETVKRVQDRLTSAEHSRRALDSLLQSLASPRKYLARLAIRTAGKTYFVNIDEVDWLRAAENYVQLHVGSARHLVHLPMQSLEESLDPAKFLRIHRSFIVNVTQVKELENAGRGEYVFVLRSGERLQSSRTYYERVKRWIDNPY